MDAKSVLQHRQQGRVVHRVISSPLVGAQSIVIIGSVCLFVCLSIILLILKITMSKLNFVNFISPL